MKVISVNADWSQSVGKFHKKWCFEIRFTRAAPIKSMRSYASKESAIKAGLRFCKSAEWEIS